MTHKDEQMAKFERAQGLVKDHGEIMRDYERSHAEHFAELARQDPDNAREFLGQLDCGMAIKVLALAVAKEIQAGHLRANK